MSNVGLYLGTFNPIHNGHVTLTEYFSSLPELDEVLVVISPQSPFKSEEELIGDYERLEMAETVFKKFDLIFNDGSTTFLQIPQKINYSYRLL